MKQRHSVPSTTRKVVTGLLIVVLLSIGLLLKVVRDFGLAPALLPLDANGTSPNFILSLAISLGILLREKAVSLWDFTKGAMGAATGMTVYEIAQIWMPSRTFDLNDIAASFVGAVFGIMLGWMLFFRVISQDGGSAHRTRRSTE